jgi:5-methylcytosine-specific restriction endonuclease McrA
MIEVIARKVAKESGFKWYFTGKPCCGGHVARRLVSNGSCDDCTRERARKHYAENIEVSREYGRDKMRARRVEKGDEVRAYDRDYYALNPVAERENTKERRKKNGDKWNAARRIVYSDTIEQKRDESRKWYRANTLIHRKSVINWRNKNPDKKRAIDLNRRARINGMEGKHSGCDIARIRKGQKNRCAYCKVSLNGRGSVDHIKAVTKGGTNWPRNLQLVCTPCNSAKNNKDPIEFARRIGKLL